MTERQQQVVIEGESSASCPVDSGVPQGTIRGPLLFLLHINDLPDRLKSQVRLFADDCLIYNTIDSVQDQLNLQQDLKLLEDWAADWGMQFNATKCYLMSIHKSTHPFSYEHTLNNHVLDQVQDNPYLGVQKCTN